MITLSLVGMGAGNPLHLTLQAVEVLNSADLILIPRKGVGKDDLAELRLSMCKQVLRGNGPMIREFIMPTRDPEIANYVQRVQAWHKNTATIWADEIQRHLGTRGHVAFLVWGDPSLYDSTLRIAKYVADGIPINVDVVPGISSLQALTAGHAIPLNTVAGPFVVTTGRRLRTQGWPAPASTVVVMLDKGGAFTCLEPEGITIWWSAYAGMPCEVRISGPLNEVADTIVQTRAQAREQHGWIMDVYLMRR